MATSAGRLTARRGASKASSDGAGGDRPLRRRRERSGAAEVAFAKLEVGAPDDEYEREADRIADHVMSAPPRGARAAKQGSSCGRCGVAQRAEAEAAEDDVAQAMEDEAEDETAQAAEADDAAEDETAQAAEAEEEEAAQAAEAEDAEDDVAQAEADEAESEDVAQAAEAEDAEDDVAQAMEAKDAEDDVAQAEAEEAEDETAQMRATRGRKRRVPGAVEGALRRLRATGGQRLPDAARGFMERRFGASFEQVRVHAGPVASRIARRLGAKAFTVGRDIVFGAGHYSPAAQDGRRLLAHELTHVLQQRGGLHRVQREVLEAREGPKRPDLESLVRRFELDRETPPAVREVVLALLERALGGAAFAEALAPLLDEEAGAGEVRRIVEAAGHRLSLTSTWAGSGRRYTWRLEDVARERLLFAGRAHRAEEGLDAPTSAAVDEARLTVPTPLGTRADDAATRRYVTPTPAVARPEEVGAEAPSEQPNLHSGGAPAGPRARVEPTPVERGALEGVDKEEAAETPEPSADQGAGESAGADNPSIPRPPVDEAQDEEVPPEPEVASEGGAEAVRRSAAPGAPRRPNAGARISALLARAGQPLPTAARGLLEARLGASFASVRVHTDGVAAEAARALGARAFTVGEHVAFARGRFDVGTQEGLRLVAHELAHVLQARRGVPAAVRRDAECPPAEPVPEVDVVASPASPGADPAFVDATGRVQNRAANQAEHGEGGALSQNANAAAEIGSGERRAEGQTQQVGQMQAEAQSPPGFDKAAFIEKVLAEVEKITPPTLDAVFKFKQSGKAGQVKQAVTGEVSSAQDKSQGGVESAASEAPAPADPARTPTPLETTPPGAPPGSVRADRAMPPPKTASEVDLRPGTVRAENILKEACITREYMDRHSDPELKGAAAAQDELSDVTSSGPAEYREQEGATLERARTDASATGQSGVAGLHGARAEAFEAVAGQQTGAKGANEGKREAAAAEIDAIFTSTQSKVTARLTKLDTDVNRTFDTDANAAVSKFTAFIDRNAEAHKKSWFETAAEWLNEALFDAPPPEVQDFYADGRRTFIADLRAAIGRVADLVKTGLDEAKELVETGKKDVEQKLETLGGDLGDLKQQKADEMNDKFRGLESTIAAKEKEIQKGLAQRYVQALEEAKKAEDAIREKYKNILEKAEDAYNAAKDAVLGWIDQLASVVGGAAKKIIKDPGKFLSNLGQGILQGLTMFIGNIGENIQSAVVQWLTGNLGSAGITLPATWDAKGIVGFLLDIVGLGVASIKGIARKVFGAKVVSAIEKGVAGAEKAKQIFDILSTEGPSGLYQHLAGEFEAMKGKIMGEAGKALAEGLVVAGIKKVIGIVSGLVSGGVGTVLTIVSTIIDVVMWFRDNAAQLAELASTIAGMADAVFNGAVGALAGAINGLLKRLLPVVLSFVGALVGIGKVVKKIQGVFKSIRKPAQKAITGLFKRIKAAIKGLLKKLKKKFGKGKKGKGKGKGKDKPLSPGKVVSLIAQGLRKPAKSDDPAAAISETQSVADALRAKYQPKLKKGTIRITLHDTAPEGVEKDDDIDITVSVNPKRKVARRVNVALQRKFAKQISASHPTTREPIRAAVDKLPKGKRIRTWSALKTSIQRVSPVQTIYSSPALASHGYGGAMSGPITAGVKTVNPNASSGHFSHVKGKINSGAYSRSLQRLQGGVYNARVSTGAIQSTVAKEYKADAPATNLKRPSLRADTKLKIRNKAIDAGDGVHWLDPNWFLRGKKVLIPKAGPFHYGHKPGHENRTILKDAEKRGLTQQQLNDEVNNHPEWFQIEDPASNLSHQFEVK